MTPEHKRRAEERMASFDRLPKIVRHAISHADYDWSSKEIAAWHKRGVRARALADCVRANDCLRRKQREEEKTWLGNARAAAKPKSTK